MKNLYPRLLLFLLSVCCSSLALSQVAIGTGATAPSPDPAAVLLLVGDGKQGLILPTGVRTNVTAPKAGMLIYDTNQVYFYNGSAWTPLGAGSSAISILGNVVTLNANGINSTFSIAQTAPAVNGQILMWDASAGRWTSSANTAPSAIGQVLKWNGSRWQPGTDDAGGTTTLPNGQIFVGNASNVATASAPSALPLSSFGAATAQVSLGNNKITNLGTPTLAADATTKAYVDAADASKLNANTLTTAGDLLYNDGSSSTRLPRGTNGQVLQSTTSGIQWATPTGSLPSLSANQLLSNNGSNVGINVGGDLTLSVTGPTGTFTIANSAVTTSKIANGAVGLTQLANGPANNVLTTNASGVPTWAAGGGSGITSLNISSSGGVNYLSASVAGSNATITTNAIVNNDISATANISGTKLQDGTLPVSKIASGSASNNQVLQFNSGSWAPATLPGAVTGNLTTSTTGLAITGGTNAVNGSGATINIQNAGTSQGGLLTQTDWNTFNNKLGASSAAGGEISGTLSALTINNNAITTAKINNGAVSDGKISDVAPSKILAGGATNGQVLKFNGTNWVPQADDVGGGATPTLSNGQILIGNGTTNSAAALSGDATLAAGVLTINNNAITTAKIINGAVTIAKIGTAGVPDANKVLTTDASGVPQWTVAAGGGDMLKSTYDPTNINGSAFNLSNHIGQITTTQITDGNVTNIKLASGIDAAKITTGTLPAAQVPGLDASKIVTGTLPVAVGGTGANSLTGLVLGNGTSPFTAISTGTNGQILTVNAGNPTWQNAPAPSGAAGGDLLGSTYPNPVIAAGVINSAKLATNAVATVNIANLAVTDAKINDVAPSKITAGGATSGQVLKFNGTNWVAQADAVGGGGAPTLNVGQVIVGDGTTNSAATVGLDATLALNGNITVQGLRGRLIDPAVPALNSVYQYNGTQWTPVVLAGGGTVTSITAGTGLTGGTISGSGTIGIAAGGIGATQLANNAVTAAKLSSDVSIDANRAVTTDHLRDGAITDAKLASGITVSKLTPGTNGQVLTTTGGVTTWQTSAALTNPMTTLGDLISGGVAGAPTRLGVGSNGQILTVTGGVPTWQNAAGASTLDALTDVTAAGATDAQILIKNGAGDFTNRSLSGDITISNLGATTIANNAVSNTKLATGIDAAKITIGTLPVGQVPSLDASKITTGTFATGQIPNLDASKITTGTFPLARITPSGTNGDVLTTVGGVPIWQAPTLSGIASGDLSGSYPNPVVAKLQGRDVVNTLPTNGQVLKWNNTLGQWEPAADDVGGGATPTLSNGQILIGNGTTNSAAALSGDGSLNAGVLTLSNSVGTRINLGLGSLATLSSVGSAEITNGTIAGADLAGNIAINTTGNITAANFVGNGSGLTGISSTVADGSITGGTAGGGVKIAANTITDANVLSLDAGKLTSGTLPNARIAAGTIDNTKLATGIDASKITSGTLPTAQVPNLDASKITTGSFAAAQIPNLDAAKINTGTLPVAVGGTGANTLTGLVVGNGTSPFSAISTGTNGQILTVNAGNPTWQNAPAPSGAAGGDLLGSTYPNPVIAAGAINSTKLATNAVATINIAPLAVTDAKINDVSPSKITAGGATSGQVLKFNGTNWVAQADNVGGGGAPTLNLGQIIVGDGTTNSAAAVGLDATLNSTNGNITIQGLRGRPIDPAVPATNSVYQFNGTQWTPVVLAGGGTVTSITAGTGLTGGIINSSGIIGIAAGGIGTTELANNAVTAAKLSSDVSIDANRAVTTDHLRDGAVTNAKLASGIAVAKLAPGSNGQVLTTSGGIATWQTSGALSNPMTTPGDLIYGAAGGTPTRLATGTGFLKGGATPSYSSINLASADVTGILSIPNGGTGGNSAAAARTNLGLGTLSTLNAVASTEITDGTIADVDISGTAAIAGSKVVPAFGAQNITTTTGSGSIGGGLNVGLANGFTINNSGNITRINGATTSFPAANAVGVLTNDGAGSLTWAPTGGGSVTTVSVVGANGFNGSVANPSSTPAITIGTSVTGLLKGNGTAISAAVAGTDYLTPTGSAAALTGFPTFNQNTTGSAASLTTGRTIALTGDVTYTSGLFNGTGNVTGAATVTRINGTSLASLTTGILKNTTGTGIPSIATGADLPVMTATVGGAVPTPPNNTTTFLRGDGTFAVPAGGGTVSTVSVVSANGFNGSVATATSTPAITIGTSLTGLLKGNGTALSAATAGTDYQAPITLTTTGTSGAATLVGNTLNVPNYAGATYSAGTGLTLATTTFSVNTSQNISTLSNLTTNGLIKTTGGTGALSVATAGTDYLTPTGNGSGLTNLNASNFSSGTLPVAQVPNLDAAKITTGSFASSQITDGTIVNADVNASAAIAGSKINPNFGAQSISTTGTLSSGAITATNLASINGAAYSWPGANASGVLTNNGTGTLTWAPSTGLSSALTSANIFVGNASNVATGVALSGDATINNSGAVTIANGAISGGTGGKISDGTITSADLAVGAVDLATTDIIGILPIARGGTNLGTTPTNGQLLIGNGTGYALNTLTAGSGINITPGAGTITIAATGGTSNLDALTDVTVATPTIGQMLVYDGTAVFNNRSLSGDVSSVAATGAVTLNNSSATRTNLGLGSLATANNPLTTNGDLIYAVGTTPTRLAAGTGFLKGGAVPSYSSVNLASADVTGILPVANGGTNSTATPTNGGVGYGTGTAHAYTTAGTSGQLLQSNGAAAPTWVNAPGAVTASNGLTKTGNDIALGGTLTSNTTIANGGFNLNLTGTGNVGIGTTAPATELQVESSAPILRMRSTQTNTLSQSYIEFGHDDGSGGYTVAGSIGDTGAADYLQVFSPNQIVFNSNFATRFTIGTNGQFGIGGTSNAGALGQVLTSGGPSAEPTWTTPSSLGTGTINRLTYWNTGSTVAAGSNLAWDNTTENLGIGWSAPERNLHLHRASAAEVFAKFTNTSTFIGAGNGFEIGINATPGDVLLRNYENTSMQFLTNNLERMRITNAGDVGIGTDAPSEVLHIASQGIGSRINSVIEGHSTSTTRGPGISIIRSKGTIAAPAAVINGDYLGGIEAKGRTASAYNQSASIEFEVDAAPSGTSVPGRIIFGTTPTGSSFTSDRMVINSDGNVGIGITSPSERFQVAGNLLANDGKFRTNRSSAAAITDGGLDLMIDGVTTAGIYTVASNALVLYAGGGERMRFDGSGRAAIGSFFPSVARLEVSSESSTTLNLNVNAVSAITTYSLVRFNRNNGLTGNITESNGVVSYNAFTGSHYAKVEEEIRYGELATLTGTNATLNKQSTEIIYGIAPSSKENDPKLLGSYLTPLNDPVHTDIHQVMAVGNGEVWVIDSGKDLEAGDYLISSATKGHAIQENGAHDLAYIFARVAAPVRWNDVTETINGVKHTKVSVFYESFIKNNKADKLEKEITSMKADIEYLKQLIGVQATKKN